MVRAAKSAYEHQRRDGYLKSFRMEVMFGRAHQVDANFIRHHRDVANFLEHLLVAFAVAADRTELAPFRERAGNGWQDEQCKLHY